MYASLLIIAAIVLAACGTAAGDPDGTADEGGMGATPEGAWVLTSADPEIDIPDGVRVTLTVAPANGNWQISGVAACNSYSGMVRTDGDVWTVVEGLGVTEMACEEPRMSIEQQFLDALQGVGAWDRLASDALALRGSGAELGFELLPPVPTAELTGTEWRLESMLSGQGETAAASSTVAEADEATLQLEPQGAVAASTGCRTFSGTWIETGDEIYFDTFGVRDDSPNEAADGTTTCTEAVVAQEDHVLSVLGDGFRAEIDGDELTLTSRDGLGLIYRAAGRNDAVEPTT